MLSISSIGTLMDPSTLVKVLKLPDKPQLHPAVILGHKIKLWGQYPAFIDGPPDQTIHGVAYKVQTQKEADRLAAYETEMYKKKGCCIHFKNGWLSGSVAPGLTFAWNADESLLKEGSFDLKDRLMYQAKLQFGS